MNVCDSLTHTQPAPATGLIASNGVNGSARTDAVPKGSGIQVHVFPEQRILCKFMLQRINSSF